ncbi:MAG: ABC transporter ATP-binding protein, partial [Candidatus Bathyarchaeia archaeon]
MAGVKIENLTVKFGDKVAIQDLSLEVKDKEFFVITGPPEAGKSTILRTIAGLQKPASGEVYIGDELVTDKEPKDRDVAMVFENLALYPNKTGFENIAFPLRQRKVAEDEIRKRVQEVAHMLLIAHLLDRLPATYSGGEQQRVALARAFVRQPKVYLMDQPLANLDALIRTEMRAELKRLVRDIGQTIIFTTHDQIEAMSMGHRIAVLNKGQVQQTDLPETVLKQPRNKFTANFLTNIPMNFLDCSFETKEGKGFLVNPNFRVDVTTFGDQLKSSGPSSEFLLGVRPVHIEIAKQQPQTESIEASVFVSEN